MTAQTSVVLARQSVEEHLYSARHLLPLTTADVAHAFAESTPPNP